MWSSRGARDSYLGYSRDQHKRYLSGDHRRYKKATATRLRILYNGWELLETGTFTLKISDTPIGDDVRRIKDGLMDSAEYDTLVEEWQGNIEDAFADHPDKKTDFNKINEFLLRARKENW